MAFITRKLSEFEFVLRKARRGQTYENIRNDESQMKNVSSFVCLWRQELQGLELPVLTSDFVLHRWCEISDRHWEYQVEELASSLLADWQVIPQIKWHSPEGFGSDPLHSCTRIGMSPAPAWLTVPLLQEIATLDCFHMDMERTQPVRQPTADMGWNGRWKFLHQL